MESIAEKIEYWKSLNENIKQEIENIHSEEELLNAFSHELSFGTGGMRGVMGIGTNRMNEVTVKKVSYALCQYLLKNFQKPSVVIAYDTRLQSVEFSEYATEIFTNLGIIVYKFNKELPTPILSHAVRKYNCDVGVVITASHNPKEYNGYKVYNAKGGQMVPSEAEKIIEEYNKNIDLKEIMDLDRDSTKIIELDTQSIIKKFIKDSIENIDETKGLSIMYSPLHGAGLDSVVEILKDYNLSVVKEQAVPDGTFPTVTSPNPEELSAMEMAIECAIKQQSDLVLATDPDCDRLGVAVRHDDEYIMLTGNQIGALLVDYLTSIQNVEGKIIAKTIVTNDLGATIAQNRGAKIVNTLTGFKYIGELMNQMELDGDMDQFVFGYEESYGYLGVNSTRDKDAVTSSWYISEFANRLKQSGKTLVDRLYELYEEFGYYLDQLDSLEYKGQSGANTIRKIMKEARNFGATLASDIVIIKDYLEGIDNLPQENVLKFEFDDHSWLAMRPSGTEPKIKFYYSINGLERKEAEEKLTRIKDELAEKLDITLP